MIRQLNILLSHGGLPLGSALALAFAAVLLLLGCGGTGPTSDARPDSSSSGSPTLLSSASNSPKVIPDTATPPEPLPAPAPLSPPRIGIAVSVEPDPFIDAILAAIQAEAPSFQAALDIQRAKANAQSLQALFRGGIDAAILVTNEPDGWGGVMATAHSANTPVVVLGRGVRTDAVGLAYRIVPDGSTIDAELLKRAGQRGILELQTTGVARPFWRDWLGITVLAKQSAATQVEARRSSAALANVFGEQVGLAITYQPQVQAGAAEALAYHDNGKPVPVLNLQNAIQPATGSAIVLFELVHALRSGTSIDPETTIQLVFNPE